MSTSFCLTCGNPFDHPTYLKRKYCKRDCYYVESAKRLILTKKDFPKGHKPWNFGAKVGFKPRPYRLGVRVSTQSEFKYKNGGGAYVLVHNWITKQKGRPQRCDHCGTTENRKYQWSNISGEYKYELTDWQRLCIPCHKRFDLRRLASL